MTHYHFDQVIDRKGTASVKYDGGPEILGRDDLLPLWVADMDFALPEEVLERVKRRVDHGIFGYTMPNHHYYSAVSGWFERRHGMRIEKDSITAVPGVVYALTCAVRAVTKPGDAVLIQEPVYYPFRSVIENNGRVCVSSELRYVSESDRAGYIIDFDDLKSTILNQDVKAFILCSPHNPVGRVWRREELMTIRDICREKGVTVIADEIHCDFVYSWSPDFISYSLVENGPAIICTAPSKTFNLAGMQASNIFISDPRLREQFRLENSRNGYGSISTLAKTAVEAVYETGEEWLDELLVYLEENILWMENFLREYLPQIRMIRPEGTYLVWLDFSRLADSPARMKRLIQDEARLWLDNGGLFCEKTWMFERVNVACPRIILQQALTRLEKAVRKISVDTSV